MLPYPDNGECTTAQYYPKADGNIRVVNSQQKWTDSSKTTLSKTRKLGEATARKRDPNSDLADLQVNFFWIPIWMPYTVLYTDYESHALVYSCTGSFWGRFQTQSFYVLTRKALDLKKDEDAEDIKAIKESATNVWGMNFPGKDIWATLKYGFQGE